jgi:transcription antitermination factor NusG
MARKWFVGHFYHGYLKQLNASFEKHQDIFDNVEMWYPQITEMIANDGHRDERHIPIFDNYVLFKFEEDSLVWTNILKQTPIIKFLTDKKTNRPIPLLNSDVDHLIEIENTKIITDYSKLIGKQVLISDGPFKNLTGWCRTIIKGRYKARISINMYNVAEKEVEINLESLELLKS